MLDVRLCWELGSVPARAIDEQAVLALMRRQGLPQWVTIEGVTYMRTTGSLAGRMRVVDDKTPEYIPAA